MQYHDMPQRTDDVLQTMHLVCFSCQLLNSPFVLEAKGYVYVIHVEVHHFSHVHMHCANLNSN